MSITIRNLILNIEEPIERIKAKSAKRLKLSESDINKVKIIRESVDARKRNNINFNYTINVDVPDEDKVLKKLNDKDITKLKDDSDIEIKYGAIKLNSRPVIVGLGPSGLFAALKLARNGYKPIVIEQGQDVDKRTKTIEDFWNGKSDLNLQSNVQFGEGGAGAFSDGKLTTRIKDPHCAFVIDELVKFGAPEETLYKSKPHIGTDILKSVVKNIREEIIKLGGEVRFNTKLQKIKIQNGKIKSIIVDKDELMCDVLILAIGHSSRDTYQMLFDSDIQLEAKPFAIGTRIEHPQNFINENQYGKYADNPRLGAADYKLTYQSKTLNRGVYSFCMCPGGAVVAAASEKNRLVTNGMSYHARSFKNANSALVVTVDKNDFEGTNPLSGMEFQRKYEEMAFKLGGGEYKAPVQLVGDFLNDRCSTKLGSVTPTYKPGYEFRQIKECLPPYVTQGLKEGIQYFDNKIKGYAMNDAVLTAIETRTSAPLRILRDQNLQCIGVSDLYPSGEGAGLAGGIISAAVDGIKVSEKIMQKFAKIND